MNSDIKRISKVKIIYSDDEHPAEYGEFEVKLSEAQLKELKELVGSVEWELLPVKKLDEN